MTGCPSDELCAYLEMLDDEGNKLSTEPSTRGPYIKVIGKNRAVSNPSSLSRCEHCGLECRETSSRGVVVAGCRHCV